MNNGAGFNNLRAFVDGEEVGMESLGMIEPNDADLLIGTRTFDGDDQFHAGGKFTAVRCYNRQLSGEELNEVLESTRPSE